MCNVTVNISISVVWGYNLPHCMVELQSCEILRVVFSSHSPLFLHISSLRERLEPCRRSVRTPLRSWTVTCWIVLWTSWSPSSCSFSSTAVLRLGIKFSSYTFHFLLTINFLSCPCQSKWIRYCYIIGLEDLWHCDESVYYIDLLMIHGNSFLCESLHTVYFSPAFPFSMI